LIVERFGLARDIDLLDLEHSQCPLLVRLRACHDDFSRVVASRLGIEFSREFVPSLQEMVAHSGGLQRRLSGILSKAAQSELLRLLQQDGKQISRILSCAEEGGAWLSAIPKSMDMILSPTIFSQRLRARLGLNIVSSIANTPCVCRRQTLVDADGYHLSAQCPVGSQRVRTHDFIANTWLDLFKSAGFLCRTEDPSCFREVADTDKRADIVVEDWCNGRRAVFDISITHPWSCEPNLRPLIAQAGQRMSQVVAPERAAIARESTKIAKYTAFLPDDAVFVPLVFESYGRWGPSARRAFKTCIDRIAVTSSYPRSSLVAFWRQRFGITLQRCLGQGLVERVHRVSSRDTYETAARRASVDYREHVYCNTASFRSHS
jgi:hypothetical protein